MARRVFYSFHYMADSWRASQIRNMGVIDGNIPVSPNDWESITRSGDRAIQNWIDNQLSGTSCTIVLIGANTAGRKWINYEIEKSWKDGKGLLGIYIHNLLDQESNRSTKGRNPFSGFAELSNIVMAYDPPYFLSNDVYAHIRRSLASWVDLAISTRNNYRGAH
ncbi:MAG: TIR domain-containing protein [Candidatus Helarchaeota archaeon]|nr:TIR domain-containing protein [Candidatus Helarchaeota archaeon]